MNFILVDTPACIITKVEVGEKLTLPVIYQLIGCRVIEAHPLPFADHWFYCDEEALLKDPVPPAFTITSWPFPIHGRILIFRAEGDQEVSPTISVDQIAGMVHF